MDATERSNVEFRVLGPVEVLPDGKPLALGGPRQRALLALLLLEAGRPVNRAALGEIGFTAAFDEGQREQALAS